MQILFDQKDQTTNEIFHFIDEALAKTESVLVHSIRGQSRSSCVIASYLMRKYRWTLLKTLEFLNSRRPNLEMRASFIHQLAAYESRLLRKPQAAYSSKWTEVFEGSGKSVFENEELLLRNTYLNSQAGPPANVRFGQSNVKKTQRLRWADNGTGNKSKLERQGSENDMQSHLKKSQDANAPTRSILKA